MLALTIISSVFMYLVLAVAMAKASYARLRRKGTNKIDSEFASFFAGIAWPVTLFLTAVFRAGDLLYRGMDFTARRSDRDRRLTAKQDRARQHARHQAELAELEARRLRALEESSGILDLRPQLAKQA